MCQAAFQGGSRVVGYRTQGTFPTERALVDKLSSWGYRAGATRQSPDKIADRCPDLPSACAVVSGKLGLNIEGQSFELDMGDCLFLPKGKTYSAEGPWQRSGMALGREQVVITHPFESMSDPRGGTSGSGAALPRGAMPITVAESQGVSYHALLQGVQPCRSHR
jgi:hypothetical protein